MGAPAFLAISAVSSLASGAVGYVGAQRQAAGYEAQAKSAQDLAAYNAQVQRNNSIAQAQDLQFQAGVSDFNQRLTQADTARSLESSQIKARAAASTKTAALSRQGLTGESFEDILRSEALLAEREEADILFAGRQQGYQSGTQADLNRLMAGRAIETGSTQAALTMAEGYATSASLQNQASAASFGGIGSLIGGVTTGAATASQLF